MFFVFHGSLENPKSIGTNKLIKEFAKIATSPEDIIENYEFLHKINDVKEIDNIETEVPDKYIDVYKVIKTNPICLDDIIKMTKLSVKQIAPKLTMLELSGYVQKLPGNRYVRCEKELL